MESKQARSRVGNSSIALNYRVNTPLAGGEVNDRTRTSAEKSEPDKRSGGRKVAVGSRVFGTGRRVDGFLGQLNAFAQASMPRHG